MNDLLHFFKENPLTISVPLSLLALFISYRALVINKKRLALDKFKIFTDFEQGFEILKIIHQQVRQLCIKQRSDLTPINLLSDKTKVEIILETLNKNEDRLKNAYITFAMLYQLKSTLSDLSKSINELFSSDSQTFDLKQMQNLHTLYGDVYFVTFLMVPVLYPKNYPTSENHDSLANMNLLDYSMELKFGTK